MNFSPIQPFIWMTVAWFIAHGIVQVRKKDRKFIRKIRALIIFYRSSLLYPYPVIHTIYGLFFR